MAGIKSITLLITAPSNHFYLGMGQAVIGALWQSHPIFNLNCYMRGLYVRYLTYYPGVFYYTKDSNFLAYLKTGLHLTSKYSGRERGIRTPDRLFTYTAFPMLRLQPLGHLSIFWMETMGLEPITTDCDLSDRLLVFLKI